MGTAASTARAQRSPLRQTNPFATTAPDTRRLGATTNARVTGSNLVCVRDHNQLLVLHTIRTRGPSTRRDLSRLTGLTFQTIENISRRLIEAEILESVPTSTSTSRARQLALRPAGANAVGIEVTPEACRVALCDLSDGTLVAEQRLSTRAANSAADLDELVLGVQDLIDESETPITAVAAVGLTVDDSLPTAADGHGPSADSALPWHEWVRDGLERRLRMPVLCTSGVVAAAREEQWSGRISCTDFIYVHLAAEIRCAIITHGQLCTGARGRGGDIAHTPAVMGGESCTCGRRGCLHTVLAEQGLRRVFATALAFAEPPTLEEIARLAASDDEAAVAFEAVATYLADALLPAVRLLDPEIVVIGGRSADALGETFRSVLERCVTDRSGGGPGPAVQRARDGAGGAASAARAVLYELFTPGMDHLVLGLPDVQPTPYR
jgi:predicted NBD/HSP70 family sugar kinase